MDRGLPSLFFPRAQHPSTSFRQRAARSPRGSVLASSGNILTFSLTQGTLMILGLKTISLEDERMESGSRVGGADENHPNLSIRFTRLQGSLLTINANTLLMVRVGGADENHPNLSIHFTRLQGSLLTINANTLLMVRVGGADENHPNLSIHFTRLQGSLLTINANTLLMVRVGGADENHPNLSIRFTLLQGSLLTINANTLLMVRVGGANENHPNLSIHSRLQGSLLTINANTMLMERVGGANENHPNLSIRFTRLQGSLLTIVSTTRVESEEGLLARIMSAEGRTSRYWRSCVPVTSSPSCEWDRTKNNIQCVAGPGRSQHVMWCYFVCRGETGGDIWGADNIEALRADEGEVSMLAQRRDEFEPYSRLVWRKQETVSSVRESIFNKGDDEEHRELLCSLAVPSSAGAQRRGRAAESRKVNKEGCQRVVKDPPFNCTNKLWGSGGEVASALASQLGDQGSIPGGPAPGPSQVEIVLDDAARRRVFSGNSRFPRPCIPAPLRPRVSFNVMFRDDGHRRVPARKPVTRRTLPRHGYCHEAVMEAFEITTLTTQIITVILRAACPSRIHPGQLIINGVHSVQYHEGLMGTNSANGKCNVPRRDSNTRTLSAVALLFRPV
ncbi:hypothetical protein PR048_025449 [Dryococelus australis]|uniref:Uncharacterized protein n=1 Tax=Dryococelus australis TaxID=614101 RepID=A0ABQ9GRE4_9NEOP|nr:hypothetical protein PR048_025449 [Dryococelus australis]